MSGYLYKHTTVRKRIVINKVNSLLLESTSFGRLGPANHKISVTETSLHHSAQKDRVISVKAASTADDIRFLSKYTEK